MENVKGVLSATLENQRIFERILEDLRSPCEAIVREGRSLADGRRRTRYKLLSLVQSENGNTEDLRRFTIRMERYGVPQARHRLIILGVRSDLNGESIGPLSESNPVSVREVISDLPEVRSGLSRVDDALDRWREEIQQIRARSFMNGHTATAERTITKTLEDALKSLSRKQLSRGGEFMKCAPQPQYRADWFVDPHLQGACNHTTRLHIPSDLHRYLFATCYAKTRNCSPDLRDFPAELLPNHRNARKSAKDGTFDDRFHVKLPDRPSTTVTSHLAKDGHHFHSSRSLPVPKHDCPRGGPATDIPRQLFLLRAEDRPVHSGWKCSSAIAGEPDRRIGVQASEGIWAGRIAWTAYQSNTVVGTCREYAARIHRRKSPFGRCFTDSAIAFDSTVKTCRDSPILSCRGLRQ